MRLRSGDRWRIIPVGDWLLLSLLEAPISHNVHRLMRLSPDEADELGAELFHFARRARKVGR